MTTFRSLTDHIGGTPLIELPNSSRRQASQATLLVKHEGFNPTGSIKDRLAKWMLRMIQQENEHNPRTVLDYSCGSYGVSLAFMCAYYNLGCHIVTASSFSRQKREAIREFGAQITLVDNETSGMSPGLIKKLRARAEELNAREDFYWTDQLYNRKGFQAYTGLAEEIAKEIEPDVFVQGVGTGLSFVGVARGLRSVGLGTRTVAVEPAESSVLSGGAPGRHAIEGIGIGLQPPIWDDDADEIHKVSVPEVERVKEYYARHGLLLGPSSAANIAAAESIRGSTQPGSVICTIINDRGEKYFGGSS